MLKMKQFSTPESKALYQKKMMQKAGSFLVSLYRYVLLISISYVIIYPMVFMITTALKTPDAFLDPSIVWIPKVFSLEGFTQAFEALDFSNSFISTLVYEIVAAVIEIFSCTLVAYGMARFDFKLKGILNVFLMLLIFIPSQMIIIPMTINFSDFDILGIVGLIENIIGEPIKINLLNSVWPFYLPSLFGVGLRAGIIIFMYIQFFKGLPKELEEAAWIDGAGPFRTFLSIAIPSSGVILFTVSVFSVIWHWNDYYLAVMYTSSNYPMAVKLNTIEESIGVLFRKFATTDKAMIVMAACLIFILPVLIMYMIVQKKFVQSIDKVGITG